MDLIQNLINSKQLWKEILTILWSKVQEMAKTSSKYYCTHLHKGGKYLNTELFATKNLRLLSLANCLSGLHEHSCCLWPCHAFTGCKSITCGIFFFLLEIVIQGLIMNTGGMVSFILSTRTCYSRHGRGGEVTVAASQLQGLWFDPELRLCCMLVLHVFLKFAVPLGALVSSQMSVGGLTILDFPWHLIQGVFLPWAPCSQDRLSLLTRIKHFLVISVLSSFTWDKNKWEIWPYTTVVKMKN